MGSWWQCAFEFRKAGADTIHHLPRIGAAQGDHQPLNRFVLTVFADHAIERQAAGSDRRLITQPNDAVVAASTPTLLSSLNRLDCADMRHDQQLTSGRAEGRKRV